MSLASLTAAALAAVVAPSPPPMAAPSTAALARPQLDLRAALDPEARRVAGTAVWRIANPTDTPLTEVLFWLYPNRFAERAPELDDVSFHWFYPNGFSPGGMQIRAVRAGGAAVTFVQEPSPAGRDTLLRVRLAAPLPPGTAGVVELDFTTEIPERLGAFGCLKETCTLMGGFHPFPVALGPSGFVRAAPPDRFDFRAAIAAPPGRDVIIGGAVTSTRPGSTISRTTTGAGSNVDALTLIVAAGLRSDEIQAGGRAVRYLHRGVRPPPSEDEVLPYVREDRAGLVLETARRALELLATSGLGRRPDAAGAPPLTLVEAPLRHTLVAAYGSVVLVSERLFEIFPLERVRRYHRRELARAVLTAALDARTREIEPDPDVDLSAEVMGAHLADLLDAIRFQKLELARDLLRPLAFLPAVDQLIYAPLVASSSSYFGDLERGETERDDVRRFAHALPDGRFIHAKLVDLVGTARVTEIGRLVAAEGIPLRRATARVFGAPLDWFWAEWLASPSPRVNYRLTAVRTTPLGPGGVHVSIDIERQGSDVREPVEVRVVDRDGVNHDLVWAEYHAASVHRFELDVPAGLDAVEIDPRHRLAESAIGSLDPADDPLSDNRRPRRLRLIYSGFGALLDLTSLRWQVAAALTLKPQHDLHNEVYLLIDHRQEIEAGLHASYERRFGRQANANRLASGAGFGLFVERPNATFGVSAGAAPQPGWRFGGGLVLEHDDRDYLIDPWHAVGFELDLGATLTALERGDRLLQVWAGVDLVRLFELAPGHVLALNLQSIVTGGDIRERSQLFNLGGARELRGYGNDELLGRGRALARLELRDRYVSDLDVNLGHFTSLRALGGNVFVEAGVVTSCDDLTVSRNDVFYDVGYTFRVLHDAFGVYQQLLAVDLAVPLGRHDRVCLGQHSLGSPADGQPSIRRPPFSILVSFLPNF
jgi:hypothetical protein